MVIIMVLLLPIVAVSGLLFSNHFALDVCPPITKEKYNSYVELTEILQCYNQTFPNITRLYSIGKSVQGRDLWVLEISAGNRHERLRPNVKLIGNIHGNEPVGKELLIQLIKHLVRKYTAIGEDAESVRIRRLLNFAKIHILPSMNPDGFELALRDLSNINDSSVLCNQGHGRKNSRDYDLNRNFPDHFQPGKNPIQNETLAVMKWMQTVPFVLSGSLHGGALVASYPYGNKPGNDRGGNEEHLTPDDDVFKHLALAYANAHPTMHRGEKCSEADNEAFPNGIVNGAKWYSIRGSMDDYNYVVHGCLETTLEVSCCKFPNVTKLPQLWQENKEALLVYMEQIYKVVRGTVVDNDGRPISNATINVLGRDIPVFSSAKGEFWRILLPGIYHLKVSANGFISEEVAIQVKELMSDQQPQNLNITLFRIGTKIVQPTTKNQSVFNGNRTESPAADTSSTSARPVHSSPTEKHMDSSCAVIYSRLWLILCLTVVNIFIGY